MITSERPTSNKALLFSTSLRAVAEMQPKPLDADIATD